MGKMAQNFVAFSKKLNFKIFFKVLEPPCTKFICWISPMQCNLSSEKPMHILRKMRVLFVFAGVGILEKWYALGQLWHRGLFARQLAASSGANAPHYNRKPKILSENYEASLPSKSIKILLESIKISITSWLF